MCGRLDGSVYAKAPAKTDRNITLVLESGLQDVVAPLAFEGAMNGEIFTTYMRECVAPLLRPNDVVVSMDSVRIGRGAREAVQARGARYPFCPVLAGPVAGGELREQGQRGAPRTVQGSTTPWGRASGG